MQEPTRGRCPAAHPEDPTPCGGPVVVTVLDAQKAGADGCEHHAVRLLASLAGGNPVPKPDAPAGLAVRIFRAAHHTRPFPWHAEAKEQAAGLASLVVPAGPVDDGPRGVPSDTEQRAALLAVLAEAGVELGKHDRRIVEWLGGWEWSTVATVASWVRRAQQETAARPAPRAAYTCARRDCLAVYLVPLDLAEGMTGEDAARAAGWQSSPAGLACPGCASGRGPVLERGECGRCMGSTTDRPAGNTCHYCGHVEPYPPGSGEW